MNFDFTDLIFTDDDLVGVGGKRKVYRNRNYDRFLFKKQRPLSELELKSDLKGFLLKRFPTLIDHMLKKEYRGYVHASVKRICDFEDAPVSKLYGFAQSNIGLVQIVEKVSLDGKVVGPTLTALYQDGGLTDSRLALLNDLVRLLLEWNIPMHDLTGNNIVLGKRAGKEKFICVDGIGDIHLIPVRTYFSRVRRDALAQSLIKTARRLDLTFDKQKFLFSRI